MRAPFRLQSNLVCIRLGPITIKSIKTFLAIFVISIKLCTKDSNDRETTVKFPILPGQGEIHRPMAQ